MTASTTRRSVLAAAGAASAAVTLAACGSGGSEGSGSEENAGGDGGSQEGGGASNGELGKAADIPEGGGKVFKEQKVVVTRPSGSEYKAFSATCTHKGCSVSEVKGGTIICPCHDSRFDISDGSVKGGPATKPLPPAKVSVKGGNIHLAEG
ncbi:Rieske (2Fe-2S) protein [Streptomyces sp. WMMB 322]|uniref:Rieske (2Fe-2S) protein n=1 Tax=Streptomyces sp. WMMB 322 TaxID=1286821 RepID=UPI0006E190B0|nr:Rieske (2Fe-2S) protein [Streptomyces sp. WMMB 322]SCK58669.1 Ferredoxin subunit of nitrite reductase or a ring-hydroxylating dioxygenase [Streptomyces sp. WMMB 322]